MFLKKARCRAQAERSQCNFLHFYSYIFTPPPPPKKKCCLQCYSSALLQLTAFPFCPPFPPPKNVPLAPRKIRKPPYTHPHPPKKTKKTGSHSPDSPYPSPHPTPPPTCPRKTQKKQRFSQSRFPLTQTPHPPPPTQKSLATLPLRIFRFPLGPISTNYWEEAATVYSPDFPQSSPQGILDNKKMPAWKPSIFPLVSLGLGWPGPKFPKFIGRPGQRKTIVKTGGLQPRFSPKRSTPNLGENKTFSFFPHQRSLGRALRKNLGWKPHFPYGFLWLGWSGAKNSQAGQR